MLGGFLFARHVRYWHKADNRTAFEFVRLRLLAPFDSPPDGSGPFENTTYLEIANFVTFITAKCRETLYKNIMCTAVTSRIAVSLNCSARSAIAITEHPFFS